MDTVYRFTTKQMRKTVAPVSRFLRPVYGSDVIVVDIHDKGESWTDTTEQTLAGTHIKERS